MVPSLRSELAAERERDLVEAADRHRLIAAAAPRPSTDSPRRRPQRRLISLVLGIATERPGIPFEVQQR